MERADQGHCFTPEVLHAYGQAIGAPVEEEMHLVVQDMLISLWSAHEMLALLYQWRARGEP